MMTNALLRALTATQPQAEPRCVECEFCKLGIELSSYHTSRTVYLCKNYDAPAEFSDTKYADTVACKKFKKGIGSIEVKHAYEEHGSDPDFLINYATTSWMK